MQVRDRRTWSCINTGLVLAAWFAESFTYVFVRSFSTAVLIQRRPMTFVDSAEQSVARGRGCVALRWLGPMIRWNVGGRECDGKRRRSSGEQHCGIGRQPRGWNKAHSLPYNHPLWPSMPRVPAALRLSVALGPDPLSRRNPSHLRLTRTD